MVSHTVGELAPHPTSTVNAIMQSLEIPPWLIGPEEDMLWHGIKCKTQIQHYTRTTGAVKFFKKAHLLVLL